MNRDLIMDTLLTKLSAPPLLFDFTAGVVANSTALNGVSASDAAHLLPGMPLSGLGLAAGAVIAGTDPPTMSVPAIRTGQITIRQGALQIGRRLKLWTDVQKQPAIFLTEGNEDYPARPSSAPARVQFTAFVWVYYKTSDKDAVPAKVLNALVDGIETALLPPADSPTGVWQNLGLHSVIHTRIEGQVLKDPGHLDGQAIARVPLVIQVAQGSVTRPL
jgi:hypothetical protein